MAGKGQPIPLDERKKIMVEMMRVFREFCQEHGLKCYLAGGTLLGAVRHHGFIPWDDDVDLYLTIDDYNHLIQLTKDEPFVGNYMVSTMHNNPDHMWPMIKMIDARTKMVDQNTVRRDLEKIQERFYGVCIDIFPLYGLPNDAAERMEFQKKITDTYTAYKRATRIMTKRPQDSQLQFRLRRMMYDLYCIPFRIRGYKYYLKTMEQLINRYALNGAEFLGASCGVVENGRDHFKTCYLNEETELPFENLRFSALAAWDEMLTTQYGDYMQLPAENERRIHPSRASWR